MPGDERDEKGFPKEGVHSLVEVTGARDRKIVELYEGDPAATTESVGKILGISGVRVSQRLEHWLLLGVKLEKYAGRRKEDKKGQP